MPLADLLISLRERLLDALSGSDRSRTLNQVAPPDADPLDGDPAAELVALLHEVLSQAPADDGERVDYAGLRASSLYDDFHRCTGRLLTFDQAALPDRDARLAFWINLYNTLVLDAIIALGVQRSVMERRAGIAFFRQAAHIVGGQRVSCDDIEHGILRANRGNPLFPGKQFGSSDPRLKWVVEPMDPRVHFALNCASRSCPPIRAYSPGQLDSQLQLAVRGYLAANLRIESEEKTVYLPAIFKWFARDFGGREGILDLLLAHLPGGEPGAWLTQNRHAVSLRYSPYDWLLNDSKGTLDVI
jgi:hypothetical protein